MTVKLLSDWGPQPAGTLFTGTAATETAMVAAGVATTSLTGGVAWVPNAGTNSDSVRMHLGYKSAAAIAALNAALLAGTVTYRAGTTVTLSNPGQADDGKTYTLLANQFTVDGGGNLIVTGTPGVGNTLTASFPTGVGTVKWQNSTDGTTWVDISGATSLTYVQASSDGGKRVRPVATTYAPFGSSVSVPSPPVSLGYDIVLLIGQSNMVGKGVYVSGTDVPSANNKQFASAPLDAAYRTVIDAAHPLHHPMGVQSTLMGLGVNFATQYTANTGRKVMLVPLAWNSTSLVGMEASWDPDTGARFLAAVDQTNRALTAALALETGSVVVGALDLQGESDGDDSISQAVYQARKADLIAKLRSSVTGASNAWHILISMVPEAVSGRPGCAAIDAAHKAIPALVAKTAFVSGISGQNIGDSLHYNATAQRQLGTNSANAVPTAVANTGSATVVPVNVGAPVITGATVQGQTLTCSKGFWSGVATAWAYQWKRAGTVISGATASTYVVQAADVGNALTCEVISSNSAGAGTVAASAATASIQATGGTITYGFEADTAGKKPAGIAVLCGRFIAVNSGYPAGWTGQAARFNAGEANIANALIVEFQNAPVVADQTVIWRRGSPTTGVGRDSMVLRAQAGTVSLGRASGETNVVAGSKQGYEFLILGTNGQLRINRLDSGVVTQLGSSFTLADATDRYFRAKVIGSTLTFDYSADGSSWTNAITTTDSTFTGAGTVQYLGGLGGSSPYTVFVDGVTIG